MEWINCWSNKIDVENLKCSHEADTKTIQHGHSAKVQGANSLSIQSPDTDAFVLTPRRYPQLGYRTVSITGVDVQHSQKYLAVFYI